MLYRCCYDDGFLPRNGQSCRSSRPRVVPLEKADGNTINFAAGHAKGTVSTLSVERTFWEKATILHALHHGSKMRPEMSRHFYDIVMMAASGVDDAALADPDLLTQVVAHKSQLFADPRASYDTAALGLLRLVPTVQLGTQLRDDYRAMGEMFMSEPPTFEQLMSRIARLEAKLNR